jgi:hypothetical protein
MACNACDKNWFLQKLGRCNRCLYQLMLLSLLSWLFWFSWGVDHFRQVETIAVLCFGLAFHLLFVAHLVMKGLIALRHQTKS